MLTSTTFTFIKDFQGKNQFDPYFDDWSFQASISFDPENCSIKPLEDLDLDWNDFCDDFILPELEKIGLDYYGKNWDEFDWGLIFKGNPAEAEKIYLILKRIRAKYNCFEINCGWVDFSDLILPTSAFLPEDEKEFTGVIKNGYHDPDFEFFPIPAKEVTFKTTKLIRFNPYNNNFLFEVTCSNSSIWDLDILSALNKIFPSWQFLPWSGFGIAEKDWFAQLFYVEPKN